MVRFKMKKILLTISTVFALVFFSGCGGEEATTIVEESGSFKDLKVQSNKNYNLLTTDAKTISFKVENQMLTTTNPDLNGKYVLFNFWATWCAPCIKEMPTLVNFYEKYKDKFVIVGVLIEKKDPEQLRAFMEKFKMNFPVTVGEENYRMAKAFDDVKMFPESFLYGPDGKFIEKFIGEIDGSELEAILGK